MLNGGLRPVCEEVYDFKKLKGTCMFKKVFFAIVCASSLFCRPVTADQRDDEIAALKEQVKQLRNENQNLRLQLGQGGAASKQETSQPSAAETAAKVKNTASSPQQAEQSFWITTSSSKRHNSSCRYYKNSKGRACSRDEGIPCKICGG